MTNESGSGASIAGAAILLAVGCISIGYDLAKIVNGLDGAGPLAGVGAMCAGLAAVFFTRGKAKS